MKVKVVLIESNPEYKSDYGLSDDGTVARNIKNEYEGIVQGYVCHPTGQTVAIVYIPTIKKLKEVELKQVEVIEE